MTFRTAKKPFLVLALLIATCSVVFAQGKDPVPTLVLLPSYQIPPAGTTWVDVTLDIPQGLHAYIERFNADDPGILTTFSVAEQAAISILEIKMPQGHRVGDMQVIDGKSNFRLLVKLNESKTPPSFSVLLRVNVQLCDTESEVCYAPKLLKAPMRFDLTKIAQTTTAPVASAAPVATTAPVVNTKEIQWIYSHAEGQKIAKAQGKRMFVLITAPSWCGSCQYMERETFTKPDVIRFINTNFVPVQIRDTINDKPNPELRTYGFEGYPTFIVAESNKKIIYQNAGGTDSVSFLKMIGPFVQTTTVAATATPTSTPKPSPTPAPTKVTQTQTQTQTSEKGSFLTMIRVEGGSFQMGGTKFAYLGPVHTATVNSFYLCRTELTFGQFKTFVEETNYVTTVEKTKKGIIHDSIVEEKADSNWRNTYQKANTDNHPVVLISWYDAVNFCNWLSKKEGLKPVYSIKEPFVKADWTANGYRLPTEAEWEFAARGGNETNGFMYAGSNDAYAVDYYNNQYQNQPVASKRQNELGFFDMSGNVWEWCWDQFRLYTSEAEVNPRGGTVSEARIRRGGRLGCAQAASPVEERYNYPPEMGSWDIGFRVARNAE